MNKWKPSDEEIVALQGRAFIFEVPRVLPDLNTILAYAKSSPFRYSTTKKKAQEDVSRALNVQKRAANFDGFQCPVFVECTWIMPDLRKDPDNVEHGIKYILDSLVATGTIPGDGARWIAGIHHTHDYRGVLTPGVIVKVTAMPAFCPEQSKPKGARK